MKQWLATIAGLFLISWAIPANAQTPNPSVVIGCSDITVIGCSAPVAEPTRNHESGCRDIISCPAPISAVTGYSARIGDCIYEDPKACEKIAAPSAVTGIIVSDNSTSTSTGSTTTTEARPLVDPAIAYLLAFPPDQGQKATSAGTTPDHSVQERIVLPAPPTAHHAVDKAPVPQARGK